MKFRSCPYIESGLVLGNRALRFCCVPGSDPTKGFVRICDYDGGPLPLETIRAERARLTELNNTPGADSPCAGCRFLEEREWPRPQAGDERFDWIGVDSYFFCNLRCAYCEIVVHEDWNLPPRGYDLLPIFRELLLAKHLAPGTRIIWGGGEPTLLQGFEELQELLLAHDVFQQINTNATRHSDLLERGLATGKVELVISVDAGTRETFRAVKGRDHFDRVWENVARYASGGGELTVKYVLRDGNSDAANVREFVRRCAEASVTAIALSNDMEEVAQDAVTEETAYAFAQMDHLARRRGMRVSIVAEYLPADGEHMLRYLPLRRLEWRHWLARGRRHLDLAAVAARRGARELVGAVTAPSALRRAAACVEEDGVDVAGALALLEHETRFPNARVRALLVAGIAEHGLAGGNARGGIAALGLGPDGWTIADEPCFVVVDNRAGSAAVEQVLWVGCYPGPKDLPVTVSLMDGRRDPVTYTFRAPERRRLVLPAVSPGTGGIFAVHVDRFWSPPDGTDQRRLGVHLSVDP